MRVTASQDTSDLPMCKKGSRWDYGRLYISPHTQRRKRGNDDKICKRVLRWVAVVKTGGRRHQNIAKFNTNKFNRKHTNRQRVFLTIFLCFTVMAFHTQRQNEHARAFVITISHTHTLPPPNEKSYTRRSQCQCWPTF